MGFMGMIPPVEKGTAAVQFNATLTYVFLLCVYMHVGICVCVCVCSGVLHRGSRAKPWQPLHCRYLAQCGMAQPCVSRPPCSDCTAKQKQNGSVSR